MAAYHFARQLYDGSWAVVHTLPGHSSNLPASQRAVAVDVEGFRSREDAEKEAAWLNRERDRDEVRWANQAGLRGVAL